MKLIKKSTMISMKYGVLIQQIFQITKFQMIEDLDSFLL